MPRPTYDEAIDAFGKVLYGDEFGEEDRSLSSVQHLVDLLSKDYKPTERKSYPYLDYLMRITRDAELDTTKGELVVTGSNAKSAKNALHTSIAGSGAFGKVFRSETGNKAYKRIEFGGHSHRDIDQNARAIFLEAWIQTVLGLDKTVNKQISTIERLYSEKVLTRIATKEPIVLIIKMGALDREFSDYLEAGTTVVSAKNVRRHEFSYVYKALNKLTSLLSYLYDTYGFVHRDCHSGNVMFGLRSLTLIDFGMSCFHFLNSAGDLVQYGDPLQFKGIKACWSFDMYLFLASILEWGDDTLSEGCARTIKDFFNVVVDGEVLNLFDQVCSLSCAPRCSLCPPADSSTTKSDCLEHTTWGFYPNTIQNTLSKTKVMGFELCNLMPFRRPSHGHKTFIGDTKAHLSNIQSQLDFYGKHSAVPPIRVNTDRLREALAKKEGGASRRHTRKNRRTRRR